MAKIISPNPDYNGESATVKFTKGVGETDDPVLIGWFKEHGYQVENKSAVTEKAAAQTKSANPKGKAKTEKPKTETQPEETQTSETEESETNTQ